MAQVIIREASYDHYESLKETIFFMLESICGKRIGAGDKVLLKPNLLSPSAPKTAILTHPLVARAAAEYVLSKGARPTLSDSSAMGTFSRIMNAGGFRETLKDLDVELKEFTDSVEVDVGAPFGRIEIAREALETALIINLPKLKSHSQMLLTLGVKNTFGCIVGLRKVEWHMKAGVDSDMFARLLVQIHHTVAPTATVLDGIVGLEGDGPGKGGDPRHIGVVMASESAVALDMAVCTMLGMQTDSLPTTRAAGRLGLIPETINLDGVLPKVENFKLPGETSLIYGPKPLQHMIRKYLLQRPVVDKNACTLCEECVDFCPADAITRKGDTLAFAYDRCIRCYCCIEICPQGALHARNTSAGKLMRQFIRRK